MTIETEDVVEPTFVEHLRRKAAATDDIGDATDFAQAADELQSLSDRIAVLAGEPTAEMIEAGQKAVPFESAPSIIRNIYVAMVRASLIKEGSDANAHRHSS